jgi:hypothetical protein
VRGGGLVYDGLLVWGGDLAFLPPAKGRVTFFCGPASGGALAFAPAVMIVHFRLPASASTLPPWRSGSLSWPSC